MEAGVDEDELRPVLPDQLLQNSAVHAVLIHRHGADPAARQLDGPVHVGGHRLLHHHHVAGPDQQRHDVVQGLIGLRQNLDAADGRLDALGAQERHELLPEDLVATVGRVEAPVRVFADDEGGDVPGQFVPVEDAGLGDAAAQGVGVFVVVAHEQVVEGPFHVQMLFLDLGHPVDPFAPLTAGAVCLRVRPQRAARGVLLSHGDHVAHALLGLDETVGLQLAVGLDHGVPVDAQQLGQNPLRGQAAAGGKLAADDLRLDLIDDLHVYRDLSPPVELYVHGSSPRCTGSQDGPPPGERRAADSSKFFRANY